VRFGISKCLYALRLRRAAAKAGMGEEMNAALRVMSRAAANRLDRGIWTSPGAGAFESLSKLSSM